MSDIHTGSHCIDFNLQFSYFSWLCCHWWLSRPLSVHSRVGSWAVAVNLTAVLMVSSLAAVRFPLVVAAEVCSCRNLLAPNRPCRLPDANRWNPSRIVSTASSCSWSIPPNVIRSRIFLVQAFWFLGLCLVSWMEWWNENEFELS